jgi:hypothetical protein
VRHYTEEALILHYYGESRGRSAMEVEAHLDRCDDCAARYRSIADALALVVKQDVPERSEQYGLEVWQRIRHRLPEPDAPWWLAWVQWERLALVATAAALVLVAFGIGRRWPQPAEPPAATPPQAVSLPADPTDVRRRVLLASVADHFDRSERVLTEIVNASERSDISSEQQWAEDLLTTSRLYRQNAMDTGEQTVANVLDDLERSLLEIVHSASPISRSDLDQIQRRIDATALLFKVRVMSDELWQRERASLERPLPRRTVVRTNGQS